ncbi:MAG: hypothetical protein ACREEQ_13910, partial [Caulobacteraceae bacterium]
AGLVVHSVTPDKRRRGSPAPRSGAGRAAIELDLVSELARPAPVLRGFAAPTGVMEGGTIGPDTGQAGAGSAH